MTHHLAKLLSFTILVGGCLATLSPRAIAQETSTDSAAKTRTAKSKKHATAKQATEPGKAQAPTSDAKTPATKSTDDAKKTKDAPPVVPSPKLIEVPQDDPTYTPRPKTTAVFVFTDGNRVESDEYLITKDALFVTKGGQKTRYPINTVDRNATKAANEGRGVDINFPKSKSEFNLDF
jgi:hypothetical protein